MSGTTGATGPTTQSLLVPNPNQPLVKGTLIDRVWWRFLNGLLSLINASASSGDLTSLSAEVTALQKEVGTGASPDISTAIATLEKEVGTLARGSAGATGATGPAGASGATGATGPGASGIGKIYAPLTNGDIPGPDAIADPAGQFIMVQIR